MSTGRSLILGFASLVVAAVTIVYLRPISEFIVERFFHPNDPLAASAIASAKEIKGRVLYRPTARSEWMRLTTETTLAHGAAVQVLSESAAEISFQNGYQIKILADSEVIAEKWNIKDPKSPFYLVVVRGAFQVEKLGKPAGGLFLFVDRKVISAETAHAMKSNSAAGGTQATRDLPIQTVNPSPTPPPGGPAGEKAADTTDALAAPEVPTTPPTGTVAAPEPAALAPPPLPDAKQKGALPDKFDDKKTLSNAYIEETLAQLTSQFRKCQTNAIRDDLPSVGQVLLSLTIQPEGKVKDVRVLQTSDVSPQLVQCTTSVIERARFNSFEGLPISLTYPIDYN